MDRSVMMNDLRELPDRFEFLYR